MIYLVSNDIKTTSTDIQSLSVEDSLKMIQSWPVVQYDSETTGLDPHICDMTSMQFGYKDFKTGISDQIVVDCKSIDPKLYKSTIENSLLIGHHLQFDLKFLYNYSITPLNVYDTMIIEQLFYLGYKPGAVSYNLHDVLLRNTGIELDKSFQKQIATKGLTEKGIRYAAGDVIYLQDIRKVQLEIAKSRNCIGAVYVENRFVPAIAYLEWCGIHLDEEKWKDKMQNDQKRLKECLDKLNNYVISHTKLNDEFVSTYTQLDLFNTSVAGPECTVDWASPKQVIPVFQSLGFNTKTKDKKTKKEKDSVEESFISNQRGIADDFLDIYFDYKDAEKKVNSYGQGHLNLINPKTGRLHTEFRQFGTVTGRMASGGDKDKGKENKDLARYKGLDPDEVRFVNFQNLPARGEEGKITRACFTAEKGNIFVSCDYSAEESRVSADVWNEKSLLDAFDQGIDTHNLYAKIFFPKELEGIDVKDVKKLRPDLRQSAKYLEFESAYGGKGYASAAKLGLEPDVVLESMSQLQKVMKGMAAFKKKEGKFLKDHGYLVINQKTGHRIYWPQWAEWKAVEDRFDRTFWNEYRAVHQGTGDQVAQMVKKHIAQGEGWFEKNVLNYPIQGGSAIILKQAAGDLFEWVVKNGYFGKILFCVFVHDEIDAECPNELKDIFPKTLEQIMEKAAAKYHKRLPIPAEVEVASYWVH